MDISNDNDAAHPIQSQAHLPMYDNVRGNLEDGNSAPSSHLESSPPPSPAPKPSKLKSSMHVRQTSTTASSTGTSTPPASRPQSSRKHSHTHDMTNNPNKNQSNNPAPNVNKNQFLLEQQIKLTQLHQLQQLQNHIFQQQMALISGQSTSISPGSTSPEFAGVGIPVDLNGLGAIGGLRPQSHDGEPQSGPHTFSGLPTPASSGEIRPMDYNTTSPPMMNLIGSLNMQYIEPLPISMIPSSNPSMKSAVTTLQPHSNIPQPNSNVSQLYGHRHSSSFSLSSSSDHLQNDHQNHLSYPPSPSTYSTISPTFHPISPMHVPISHPYHRPSNSHQNLSSHLTPHLSAAHLSQHQIQAHPHSHPSPSTSTPISAHPVSERVAFNGGNSLHATPHLHAVISVHASPNVLGSGTPSVGRQFGHVPQFSDLDLDQDISPLTSPWLGATVSSSGGTAVSASVPAAPHASGALMQKVEASHPPAKRTSVSGNKRSASESGDEGDAWSRGGTNRNSRKRPVLGTGARAGSFTGSVGSNPAAATPGLVGHELEKGEDDGKNRGSTSPNSTSPTSVSSPVGTSMALAREPLVRGGGGGGGGHLNGGGSSATPLTTCTGGSSRRTRKGSRSTSTTSTPLLRSTPATTNLLSPLSPLSPVFHSGGGTALGRRSGRFGGGQGQGRELNSPSPVDLNLEVGQGQDGKNGRSMPPPPLPRGGGDVDMNATEPTSSMDDSSGHLRHGMLGMGYDGMLSLDEGMGVGMGMGGMGGLEMGVGGLHGMGGMDMSEMGGMGSMSGIGGLTMEEMGVDMGMGVNMGGFGNSHEHSSHHLEQRGMRLDYGREHDEEGIHVSSSMSSTGRPNAGSDGMRSTTHQRQRSQSHLPPHSEYQQAQPHLSPAQHPHPRRLSLQSPQVHQPQTELSQHHQLTQPSPVNQPTQQQQQQPMMPVATPSSILNLGRLGGGSGGRLGSVLVPTGGNAASSSGGTGVLTRAKKATKASKDVGASSNGTPSGKRAMTTSMVGLGVGVSPSLKPFRPESTLPSPALSGSIGPSSSASKVAAPAVYDDGAAAGSTGGGSITATPILSPADAIGVIRQPKRTHRDAEQRRRNSQKQVIDELRRLLPPIALPSEYAANGNGDSDPASLPGTSPFFFHPTATLLPGGLPPRGPPKAGGEGPNKNVSKLQVLLCGNEYIKLLKARVERRDDEIGNLRREVRRLRALRGGASDEDVGREEDDLEKDLDAVERLHMVAGKGAGSSAAGSSVQGGSMGQGGGGPDDAMDEDDEDD